MTIIFGHYCVPGEYIGCHSVPLCITPVMHYPSYVYNLIVLPIWPNVQYQTVWVSSLWTASLCSLWWLYIKQTTKLEIGLNITLKRLRAPSTPPLHHCSSDSHQCLYSASIINFKSQTLSQKVKTVELGAECWVDSLEMDGSLKLWRQLRWLEPWRTNRSFEVHWRVQCLHM